MARPLRVEYPGALYHVISRGNGYQDIYRNDNDREKFLHWIANAVEIHNIICHAYCLMDNHYHLLIETPDANLSKAMRGINGNYTQSFNARHKTVGHLFQGRYKAFVIEKEMYLLEVARYIVLNPVRDKSVKHPREWRWSSYRYTAEGKEPPQWLHIDWILGYFGKNVKNAKKRYRQFIKDGFDADDPYNGISNGFLLGSPQFVHWIWETQTNGSEEIKEHTREQRVVGRPSLDEIFEGVETKIERNSVIIFARIRCGYSASEIAKHINLHYVTISRILNERQKC
ncbi:MAG: transposase [Patescibacteria group bacterium]